jgi:hypothetical protein
VRATARLRHQGQSLRTLADALDKEQEWAVDEGTNGALSDMSARLREAADLVDGVVDDLAERFP